MDVVNRLVEDASAQSVVDFGLHFILTNDPTATEGPPEAMQVGITSFKMFMAYKKRDHACLEHLIADSSLSLATHFPLRGWSCLWRWYTLLATR